MVTNKKERAAGAPYFGRSRSDVNTSLRRIRQVHYMERHVLAGGSAALTWISFDSSFHYNFVPNFCVKMHFILSHRPGKDSSISKFQRGSGQTRKALGGENGSTDLIACPAAAGINWLTAETKPKPENEKTQKKKRQRQKKRI